MRCVADWAVDVDAVEEMRFFTLLKRPLDSDEVADWLCWASDEPPRENRLDSRWLDFFLSPILADTSGLVGLVGRLGGERVYSVLCKAEHVFKGARRHSKQDTMQRWAASADTCIEGKENVRRNSGLVRAGTKNAIFALSEPSQIRWAVSQTTRVRHRPILAVLR